MRMSDRDYIELRLGHLGTCSDAMGSKKHKGWLRDAIRIAKEEVARADVLRSVIASYDAGDLDELTAFHRIRGLLEQTP